MPFPIGFHHHTRTRTRDQVPTYILPTDYPHINPDLDRGLAFQPNN
jgi:hypothetical protein